MSGEKQWADILRAAFLHERARAEAAEALYAAAIRAAKAERALRLADAALRARRYEAGTALHSEAAIRVAKCCADLRALGIEP